MLSTSASEDVQNVALRVEATVLSQGANWSAHRLIGNANETQSDIIDTPLRGIHISVLIDFVRELLHGRDSELFIERLVL